MKERSLDVVVHGDPVPCARPRRSRNGGVYMPDKAAAYQRAVATVVMLAARKECWVRVAKGVRVALHVRVFRRADRGDLSNFVKAVEDGINDAGNVWHDDRYVGVIVAAMYVDAQRPRVELSVIVKGDE